MNFIKQAVLPKCSYLWLLLLLFFPAAQLYSQSFTASETSARFVNESDYDSLIRAIALPVAAERKVSPADLDRRYTDQRYQLAEKLQPLLQSRYTVLDKTYEKASFDPGTIAYLKIKNLYLKEARNIIETILTGTDVFSALLEPDNNDRILHFHSDITVQADGRLLVSELITVFNGDGQTVSDNSSPNDAIQRGIVRDFPTSYIDKKGFWSAVGFTLKGVFKNGAAEPYIIENLSNGVRIKAGSKDVILPKGIYSYRIDYQTDRQLIFHPEKDELYWNVNGNGWSFTADTVSCTIHFPKGAVIKEYACYTGSEGSTAHDCNAVTENTTDIAFSGSGRFDAYQGLTVAAAIQKGILLPPGRMDNAIAFLRSNYIIPVLALLLILLFVYYYFIWYRKGRDPHKAVIYPQFSPPPALTPADLGYIIDQRYGSHLFAAALVDCAVKKTLSIEVKKEGTLIKQPAYYFSRPANTEQLLSSVEHYGFNVQQLYGQKATRGTYNSTLKMCYNALEETLKKRFLIRSGKKNTWEGLFMLNKGYTRFGGFVLAAALAVSIFFMISHPSEKLLIITASLMTALLILHIFFVRIMSAYTKQGRDIADHILGFKMYLEQAEQNVFDTLTPPDKTLELFEKYLPFAIALKVENRWAEKFDDIMQKAIAEGYQPAYYTMGHGLGSSFSMSDMSRGISSGLSGTVSSASTPPSTSSGGSGGSGSSGGGGGGGGGGGW